MKEFAIKLSSQEIVALRNVIKETLLNLEYEKKFSRYIDNGNIIITMCQEEMGALQSAFQKLL